MNNVTLNVIGKKLDILNLKMLEIARYETDELQVCKKLEPIAKEYDMYIAIAYTLKPNWFTRRSLRKQHEIIQTLIEKLRRATNGKN